MSETAERRRARQTARPGVDGTSPPGLGAEGTRGPIEAHGATLPGIDAPPRAAGVAAGDGSSGAERRLLVLATELAALAEATNPVDEALSLLGRVFSGAGDLTSLLYSAWLETRGDKARSLALAWAREQVRLALEDLIGREATTGRLRGDLCPAALAWLTLSGVEAFAQEPAGAWRDRVQLLREFLRGPACDREDLALARARQTVSPRSPTPANR